MSRLWKKAGVALGSGILIIGIFYYLVPLFFPLPEGIDEPPDKGLVFADRNGEPIRRFLTDDGLKVDPFVRYDELPAHLVEATIAAEDQRFFHHGGVDFWATGRAVIQAAANQRIVSGASTITQQFIKISSPAKARSIPTKIREAACARKLESFLSKEEIFAGYINRLPYGNQLTGCRVAARRYFGKPVGDLSLAESAFLAGLPNKPSVLNPWKNFSGAKKRQEWILGRMLEEQFIDENQYNIARDETLVLQSVKRGVFHAPHFVNLYVKKSPAPSGNAQIDTSLDLSLQNFVESSVSQNIGRILEKQFNGESADLQAAVVVIENTTGEILALSGSSSFFQSATGQINGAWTGRSAGSTLKPFTYLLAMEKGYTAGSILPDIPVQYVSSAGAFNPVNFDRRFNGPVTIRKALATSLNVPAVRVLNEIGGPRVLHQALKEDLGLTSLKGDGLIHGLGLTLGNAEVRLLELSNAYACLARLGEWKPYRFTKAESEVKGRQVFDRNNAWIMADILSDNEARAPAFGYDSALRFPYKVAAKTGTSTDYRDNWTIGFTPKYTVGVWLGRFDNRPLPNALTGALGAGPIFQEVMSHLNKGGESTWYSKPGKIVEREIDLLNGKSVNSELDFHPKKSAHEYFLNHFLPEVATRNDYSNEGKTLLPITYMTWWGKEGNQYRGAGEIRQEPTSKEPKDISFRITSPMSGTTAYLDPDLPSGGQKFPLRIAGTGREQIEWSSESLDIAKKGSLYWVILKPGTHTVEAIDRKSGVKKASRIVVETL